MQSKSATNIKVIDVSHHQGVINWSAVKADGVQGAFIKATEGRTGLDDKFAVNGKGAAAVGLPVGYYHYAHPENNDPLAEAAKFVSAVKGYKADFPHVLDVEGQAKNVGAGKLSAWCVAWLQEVERLTGHPTMIYTGASFAKSYLGKQLASWPLWVAHYGVDTPMTNSTWDKWSAFQYTSTGKVQGITGDVDINAMEVDFFNKYTKQQIAAVEEDYMLKPEDANKVIKFLSAAYMIVGNVTGSEFNRLANELRKASGQNEQ